MAVVGAALFAVVLVFWLAVAGLPVVCVAVFVCEVREVVFVLAELAAGCWVLVLDGCAAAFCEVVEVLCPAAGDGLRLVLVEDEPVWALTRVFAAMVRSAIKDVRRSLRIAETFSFDYEKTNVARLKPKNKNSSRLVAFF